jgi:zinc transporter ZupT
MDGVVVDSARFLAEVILLLWKAASASGASAGVAPYGIPLNGWKVIFQAFLTLLNVACWLIPLRSKKISENKLALSLANAFSGGVFLSLAFGHLIPECARLDASNLPARTPFMLVLAGYLLIFCRKSGLIAHDILHGMDKKTSWYRWRFEVATNRLRAARSGRSAVILLGALAVHSILEMMALGLSDTFGDCALLSLSIALHQPAESIALLVAFLKSGMPKPQIVQFLSVFSCMGPVGVALGMAVNEFAAPIVDSIMLAIVAGTFVYVGATEVIPESKHPTTSGKVCFVGIVSYWLRHDELL